MSFFLSAPFFLGGIAFIAVPIIFHIFPKLKPEILRFSTIKIFKEDSDMFSKSLRLKDLIRLLIRILFIIFLSLAFSHPSIEGKRNKVNQIKYQDILLGYELSPKIIVKDLPLRLRLFFKSKHIGFRIVVKEGKKLITEQKVPADYNSISMNIEFKDSGDHRLSVFIGENNKNIADIHLYVKDNYNILLISSKKNVISDSFFKSFGDKYFIYRQSLPESISKIDLENSDIIIVKDTMDITIDKYRLFEFYLKKGGNIWIFPTKNMDCEYTNKMFHSYSEDYNGFLAFDYISSYNKRLSNLKILKSSISLIPYKLPDREYTVFSYKKNDDNAYKLVECGNDVLAFIKDFGIGKCVSFLSPLEKDNPLFSDMAKMPIYLTALLESTFYRKNSTDLEKKVINIDRKVSKKGPSSDYFKLFIILCMIICFIELFFFLKFKKV